MQEHAQGLLPWLTPSELSEEQSALYTAILDGRSGGAGQPFAMTDSDGRLRGPFNAMLLSPSIGSAMNQFGIAIRYGSSLSDRETEIAILELARIRESDFERYAHERVALQIGMTDAEVAALRDGRDVASFSRTERTVRALVSVLVTGTVPTEDEVRVASEEVGVARLTEIIALVGYYNLLATLLAFWRIPAE